MFVLLSSKRNARFASFEWATGVLQIEEAGELLAEEAGVLLAEVEGVPLAEKAEVPLVRETLVFRPGEGRALGRKVAVGTVRSVTSAESEPSLKKDGAPLGFPICRDDCRCGVTEDDFVESTFLLSDEDSLGPDDVLFLSGVSFGDSVFLPFPFFCLFSEDAGFSPILWLWAFSRIADVFSAPFLDDFFFPLFDAFLFFLLDLSPLLSRLFAQILLIRLLNSLSETMTFVSFKRSSTSAGKKTIATKRLELLNV